MISQFIPMGKAPLPVLTKLMSQICMDLKHPMVNGNLLKNTRRTYLMVIIILRIKNTHFDRCFREFFERGTAPFKQRMNMKRNKNNNSEN